MRKALFLLSIPVYTRLLSTADYGLFQIFQTYVALGAALLTLNFHGAVIRYRFEESDDFPAFVGTSLGGSLLLVSLSFLVLLIFAEGVSNRLGIPSSLLLPLYPATFLMALFMTYQGVCVANKRSASLTTLNASRSYIAFAAGVALIFLFTDRPYLGPVVGSIVASLLVGLLIARRLAGEIRWAPRPAHVRYILGFATPLALYTLSTILLGQLDRVKRSCRSSCSRSSSSRRRTPPGARATPAMRSSSRRSTSSPGLSMHCAAALPCPKTRS